MHYALIMVFSPHSFQILPTYLLTQLNAFCLSFFKQTRKQTIIIIKIDKEKTQDTYHMYMCVDTHTSKHKNTKLEAVIHSK